MNVREVSPAFGPVVLALLLTTCGCHTPSLPTPASQQAVAERHAVVESQREQLAMIPLPSKTRYMAVRSFDSWQNPAITVQTGMLELRVILADANPSPIGAGGMLRPVGARKQDLTISYDKLGEAISAIPESAWPYGRVIALEEAHKTPPAARPAIRRAMETTISKLNELGVVVYDPTEGSLR